MKRFLLSLSMLAAMAVALAGNSEPQKRHIYIFGGGISFSDSLAYITEIQDIDAYIQSNGFLNDRSLYTLQLNNHLVSKRGREHITCAVFFSTKKAKAEKKREKLKKKYRTGFLGMRLIELRADEFHFTTEEWVPPLTTETVEPNPAADKPKKKKK